MKKVILSLVFVLATGTTFMNANTNNEKLTLLVVKKDCVELAMETQGDLEDNGVPMETANEAASLIYDLCMLGNE